MVTEENVFFHAGKAVIEGELAYDDGVSGAPAVVICPPHPQLGGDMGNNVVSAIHKSAVSNKLVSLRFNYRGVGRSQGNYREHSDIEDVKSFWEDSRSTLDELRVQDVFAAIDFLKRISSVEQDFIFMVGYSFGAYAAMQAAVSAPHLRALVLIAPTIHFHDYSPLNKNSVPKMVVSSDNDFSYSMEELETAYSRFSSPKSLKLFRGADHFFIGCEAEVSLCVTEFIIKLCGQGTFSE